MTSPADKLDALALQLSQAAQGLRSGAVSLETDTKQRMGLLLAGANLIDTISQPPEKLMLILPHICHLTAINIFIKCKAFQEIPSGDGASISYADLAAKVGGDVSLITRFARALIVHGTLTQPSPSHVAHTPFSSLLTTPNPIWAFAQLTFTNQMPAFTSLPAYFSQFGLREPTDRHQTPLAFAHDALGSTVWDIANSSPERLQVFSLAMAAAEQQLPALGGYDLGWVVQSAAGSVDEERAVVVDVGGGKGQALKEIFRLTEGLEGFKERCVLEDLPEVVEGVEGDKGLEGVRLVGMDFHREQPVKGALVYYMRRCLHDYSDEEGVTILKHIAGAMAADSKLLIVETLLSDQPTPIQATMDLMMMAISGKERTLDNFQDITGRAGLKITHVAPPNIPGGTAVVECALV